MTEQELFAKAVAFAAEKHKSQTRRDGSPYIYHPLKVAEILKDAGYDIHYQIAAVLHDTLEDTDATEEEIRAFGEDVLEAVRLVTRPAGMDEEQYVEAILDNRMASVVKNADKIHNMQDVILCEDRKWAEKYAQKVEQYYRGKFSVALDRAIDDALAPGAHARAVERWTAYSTDEMMLYSDKREKIYEECKEWYMNNSIYPDFASLTMEYWKDTLVKIYFCFSEYGKFWSLTGAGWKPTSYNPFAEDEYGTDLRKIDRAEVDAQIEKMKQENRFFDFVDVTKL